MRESWLGRRSFLAGGAAAAALAPGCASRIADEGLAPAEIRDIRAQDTTLAMFVDRFSAGLADMTIERVDSYNDYRRLVGRSEIAAHGRAALAVEAYFLNGGERALICNAPLTEGDAATANLTLALSTLAGMAAPRFNFLLLPGANPNGGRSAFALTPIVASAVRLCRGRRAMLMLDAPDAPSGAANWRQSVRLDDPNAALFAPSLQREGAGAAPVSAAAAAAGVYVRFDRARGVWATPAGAEADVRGLSLPSALSERDVEAMGGGGVNVIRQIDGRPAIWAARTASSQSEWRYVPVRRLALHVEQSLTNGFLWTVHEANDSTLWRTIQASASAFLDTLNEQGALQGSGASDAYFVRCDETTTTASDQLAGVVNVIVGIAPLRAGEFIELRLSLSAKTFEETQAEQSEEPA